MTQYERDILQEIDKPGSVQGLMWGAAMSVALGHLQRSGYLTRGSEPRLTDKGRAALEGGDALAKMEKADDHTD